MAVVLICTLPATWFGYKLRQANREKGAVAFVQQHGGTIKYGWPRELFGQWFPDTAWQIDFRNTHFRGQTIDLGPLSSLQNVEILRLQHIQVRDLTPLAQLKNLRVLNLYSTQVGDLTPLAELENLEGLALIYTQDSDLAPLAELENLQFLSLNYSQISDLTPLAQLKSLEDLDLVGTHVSDEQVRALQEALPNCQIHYK